MRDAIVRVPRALIIIQMDIRPRFGLHCQSDSPWVDHVPRGAPQREVCPGREPVVDRTFPTPRTFHLAPSNSSLANFIPRVYCGRPWHGRSHPSPPQEFPPHGAFRPWQSLKSRSSSHVGGFDQRRDSGWIHTLLEEAENERMHLMFVAKFLV